MECTQEHDIHLCREIIVQESLNNRKELKFRVGMRSMRERFGDIQKEYLTKNRTDERSSGTSIDITEQDQLLEEITEKEKAAEENREYDKNKKYRQIQQKLRKQGETDKEVAERRGKESGGEKAVREEWREKCKMEKNIEGERVRDKKNAERENQAKRAKEQQSQMQEMSHVMQQ
ncbi:hypothetical protein pdam_00024605, partial [Pocillopora damicornis]